MNQRFSQLNDRLNDDDLDLIAEALDTLATSIESETAEIDGGYAAWAAERTLVRVRELQAAFASDTSATPTIEVPEAAVTSN